MVNVLPFFVHFLFLPCSLPIYTARFIISDRFPVYTGKRTIAKRKEDTFPLDGPTMHFLSMLPFFDPPNRLAPLGQGRIQKSDWGWPQDIGEGKGAKIIFRFFFFLIWGTLFSPKNAPALGSQCNNVYFLHSCIR